MNNITFKYVDPDLGYKVLVKFNSDVTAVELVDNFLAFAQGITFDKECVLDAMMDVAMQEGEGARIRRIQRDLRNDG